MGVKVEGGRNLHEETREKEIDFFILFSSATTLLGLAGLGNYTAANAYLDGLAQYRRGIGLPALSINWSGWDKLGMAKAVGPRRESQWRAIGMEPFSPEQALEILEYLMQQDRAQVGALKIDWAKFFEQYGVGGEPRLLSDLAKEELPRIQKAVSKVERTELLERLSNAFPTERLNLMFDHVKSEVIRVLMLDSSHQIDARQPLIRLGLDSLMAVELRNSLSLTIRRKLPATLLFDYPTIESLSERLIEELFDQQPESYELGEMLAAEA
jgi:polyketide synthase 12/myxalamid-type polyketide synthase MxaB